MSWDPLVPSRSQVYRKVRQQPITLTCTTGGKYPRRIFVTVRPDLIDEPPEFWKLGQDVTVLLGKDEHAGQMRIIAGGPTIIKSTGGSGKTVAAQGLRITLREWDAIAPGGHPATPPTEDDHGADWLEFRLPEWATAAAPASPKKIAAVPDQPAKPAPDQPTKPDHPSKHATQPHGKRAA